MKNQHISVARYSAHEVAEKFLNLYACLTFKRELEEIGIGRFQFFRRRKALRELKALSVALWEVALQKSFPEDAEDFFRLFRSTSPDMAGDGKRARRMHDRVNGYIELLTPKKDADFLPVADHLAGMLASHDGELPRLRVKLSLIIRNLYTLIFDRLV